MNAHVQTQNHAPLGRRIAGVLATALLAAIALKWVWARVAVDLFALPQASFAQATAVVTALAAVLLLTRVILAPVEAGSAS